MSDLVESLIQAGAEGPDGPVLERLLLTEWLLGCAGLASPPGPTTAVAADPAELVVRPNVTGVTVSGVLPAVPWGDRCAHLVVLAGDRVLRFERASLVVRPGTNLAGEPRDTVRLPDVELPAGAVGPAPPSTPSSTPSSAPPSTPSWAPPLAEFRRRAALGRASLIAGAAGAALAMSVRHAGERAQFGRPIGRFQAVAQQLAVAASEVAGAVASARAAGQIAQRDGFGSESALVAVAAAKCWASEVAGSVAAIAHQVHGAVGLSTEHPLGRATTRLWAWRDEDGSETEWGEVLGTMAGEGGPARLWPLLTGYP